MVFLRAILFTVFDASMIVGDRGDARTTRCSRFNSAMDLVKLRCHLARSALLALFTRVSRRALRRERDLASSFDMPSSLAIE
jgi:hypothetical protein